MDLDFVRSPYSGQGPRSAKKFFEGGLNAARWHSDFCCIEVGFSEGPNGSSLHTTIVPDQFEHVARIMMTADPQAAIRAFGAAMQEAEITRAQDESVSAAA
jgi:hypothetical protein